MIDVTRECPSTKGRNRIFPKPPLALALPTVASVQFSWVLPTSTFFLSLNFLGKWNEVSRQAVHVNVT